jgi:hypothetical protein
LKRAFNILNHHFTTAFPGLSLFNGTTPSVVQNIPSNLRTLSAEKEITSMAWGDLTERQLLMGLADQSVQTYHPAKGRLKTIKAECGEGPIVGVAKFNE